MSDFRLKYGTALGPYGSVGATSAQNLLTPGDTTPDVSLGTFFVTANTSATSISYFDVVGPGGIDPITAQNGKWLVIRHQDANTTYTPSAVLLLTSTAGALPTNSIIQFIGYNSAWYEMSRTLPSAASVTPYRIQRVSFGATGVFNVTSTNALYLTTTVAGATLAGFVGGVSGQTLDVTLLSIATATFISQSAGILSLAGTGAFAMSASGVYRFLCVDGTLWVSQSGLVSP